jgi:hypothetical protein
MVRYLTGIAHVVVFVDTFLRVSVSFFFQPKRFPWYIDHPSFGTWQCQNKKMAFPYHYDSGDLPDMASIIKIR